MRRSYYIGTRINPDYPVERISEHKPSLSDTTTLYAATETRSGYAKEDPERWRLSLHEPSHATANLAVGIPIERVWLETNISTGAQRGRCRASACAEDDFVEIFTVLAGEAADWMFLGRKHDESSADRRKVYQLATLLDRENWGEVVRQAWDHACDFVVDHRQKIEDVAERLYEAGELNGDQVLWIAEQTPWPWRGIRTLGYRKPPSAQEWENRNERIREILAERNAASPKRPKRAAEVEVTTRRTDGWFIRSPLAASDASNWDRPRRSWTDSRTLEFLRGRA